jgi:23S rRNA (guanosine2251-2'-O)-methyltransferase
VREALANPRRRSLELFCTENARNRLDVAVDAELKQTTLTSRELDGKVGPDAVHQGVILNARPLPAPDFDPTGHEIWVVLDQVTDPHNVGAIIRSAVAIGATAILTTQRNAPSESGTLLKSASGAFEHIAYIQLSNLADGLRTLGKAGVFRIGLDSDGPAPLETALENRFSGAPVAIVLGAEGKGLRTLTREHCDQLARLDLPGPIHSLNVSNAAALALYLTHKARP